MKLGAYTDYDSRQVALAESALFTLWPNLEPWHHDIVPVDFLTDAPPHTRGSATVDDIVANIARREAWAADNVLTGLTGLIQLTRVTPFLLNQGLRLVDAGLSAKLNIKDLERGCPEPRGCWETSPSSPLPNSAVGSRDEG